MCLASLRVALLVTITCAHDPDRSMDHHLVKQHLFSCFCIGGKKRPKGPEALGHLQYPRRPRNNEDTFVNIDAEADHPTVATYISNSFSINRMKFMRTRLDFK